ncbi:Hsp20 family protein [Methanobrevibacter sp.]|uniref:Hsp20 family protein n=1 Tax=Methanobrevibacter sp. TaxID=66852 RepID=UPI00386DE479
MVDEETIDTEFTEKEETFEENTDEEKSKFGEKRDETKEKIDETKEKTKNIADNVINDFYKSIDEFKESIKNMQKSADQKYADYKKTTVQTIDIDLVETKETYYIKAAVPGVEKEDVSIEAGDNDITIETCFKPYIEEFEEEDEAEAIVCAIKSGKCVKTVRFENSIDLQNISAKFSNGIVIVTIPKLIIPKHKVNVE